MSTIAFVLSLVTSVVPASVQDAAAPPAPPPPVAADAVSSLAEQERFLATASIGTVRSAGKGVAGTQRATLSDGRVTHDASIQTIDQSKAQFQTARRVELGFRDYWGFNVAAYRLAVMLGMDMVPPSVPRKFRGGDAAFTWWVDNVILDEMQRIEQKREPPSGARWSEQIHIMRVFDELIANIDRNQGNLLIDRHWKIWFIDHTRAFRTNKTLRAPATIVRCEQSLLDGMKALSLDTMRAPLEAYLTGTQLDAILARRDLLVSRIESLGPNAVYRITPP